MTAQSPDLNCALYLWRLQVYNDYNVASMEALLKFLKDTKEPSHKYVPPSLLSGGRNAASALDPKFTDMYPPYDDLGALQGLMATAIVVADAALLLWIAGSLVFFWRSVVDVICNPLEGRYIVCEDKWSYFVGYKQEENEETKVVDHRRKELLERLEAIREEIHSLLDQNAETSHQLPKRNVRNQGSKDNHETLHVVKPPKTRRRAQTGGQTSNSNADAAIEEAMEDLLAAYITELNEGNEESVYPHGGMVPTERDNE